jgi:hypothetical protein
MWRPVQRMVHDVNCSVREAASRFVSSILCEPCEAKAAHTPTSLARQSGSDYFHHTRMSVATHTRTSLVHWNLSRVGLARQTRTCMGTLSHVLRMHSDRIPPGKTFILVFFVVFLGSSKDNMCQATADSFYVLPIHDSSYHTAPRCFGV